MIKFSETSEENPEKSEEDWKTKKLKWGKNCYSHILVYRILDIHIKFLFIGLGTKNKEPNEASYSLFLKGLNEKCKFSKYSTTSYLIFHF